MERTASIRTAETRDCEAICAIYNTAVAERSSTFEIGLRSASDFEARLGGDRLPFLAAEVAGLVVGWAALSRYSDRECYAGIGECSVYVAAESRGGGIGTALCEALAGVAAGEAFHKLLGKVLRENRSAIRLCERCGFVTVGVHRRHGRLAEAWRDVVLVERLLPIDG